MAHQGGPRAQSHRVNAMQVLIVDDDPVALDLLDQALTYFGYQVSTAGNGKEALKLMHSGLFRIVICDWEMPEMDGLELCRRIRQQYYGGYVYVILLTVHSGTQKIVEGLNAGADEFISKPFDPVELSVRVRTGERILSIESRDVTIFSLARIAESRDQRTAAHVDRIREYCRLIAEHLSALPKFSDQVDADFVHLIYLTSPLHDIGKVGIPDQILLKPGPLTEEDFEIVKQHTVTGSTSLDSAIYIHPEARFLCMARDIARSHHERFDGGGYPDGLMGDAIPLCARIVALADVYDALTTDRVYKPAISHEAAREIILKGMGTQFDPDVVQAFLANEDAFQEVHDRFAARSEREELALQPRAEPSLTY
jgi:putative two-component system response regulator